MSDPMMFALVILIFADGSIFEGRFRTPSTEAKVHPCPRRLTKVVAHAEHACDLQIFVKGGAHPKMIIPLIGGVRTECTLSEVLGEYSLINFANHEVVEKAAESEEEFTVESAKEAIERAGRAVDFLASKFFNQGE